MVTRKMERPNRHVADGAGDDYRTSHLQKGSCYDDRLSEDSWNRYLDRQEQDLTRMIVQKFFDGRAGRCLDFACGTGRLTAALEGLAGECIGVDLSPGMLEKARTKCKRARFVQCDLTIESPNIGVFDLITAFRFFGNAQDALRAEALAALYRYLDPDGYLVVNNHRNPNAPQNVLSRWTGGETAMDLTFAKLRRHAEACGFGIVDLYGIGGWSLRHRWHSWAAHPSKTVRFLERVARLRIFAPFAPDWIVVLKKSPLSPGAELNRAGRP